MYRPPFACFAVAAAFAAAACEAHAQAASDPGWQVMTNAKLGNCVACHALPGLSGQRSDFAPALDQVGARYNAAQLTQWVSDARQIKPDTLMPPFATTAGLLRPFPDTATLTALQIQQVVQTLQSWK